MGHVARTRNIDLGVDGMIKLERIFCRRPYLEGNQKHEPNNPLEEYAVILMVENSSQGEFIHVLNGILMIWVDGLLLCLLSINIE